MAAPTLDGSASGQINGGSSGSATLTTTGAGVIVVLVGIENPTTLRTVAASGVTATGLTFTQRKAYTGTAGSTKLAAETWWAPSSGAVTGKVINVSLSGSADGCVIIAFGVAGAHDNTSPWDSNASAANEVYADAGLGSPGTQPTFTTSQANDFIFGAGLTASPHEQTSGAWTVIKDIQDASPPSLWCYFGSYYERVSSTQSGATADLTGTGNPQLRFVDAITADATVSTETATAALHFSGVSMVGAGTRDETATGALHFGGISFSAAGSRQETATAAMHFSGIRFVGAGTLARTVTAALHFAGIAIKAAMLELGATLGPVSFWVF